jgi:hypothetical protein
VNLISTEHDFDESSHPLHARYRSDATHSRGLWGGTLTGSVFSYGLQQFVVLEPVTTTYSSNVCARV